MAIAIRQPQPPARVLRPMSVDALRKIMDKLQRNEEWAQVRRIATGLYGEKATTAEIEYSLEYYTGRPVLEPFNLIVRDSENKELSFDLNGDYWRKYVCREPYCSHEGHHTIYQHFEHEYERANPDHQDSDYAYREFFMMGDAEDYLATHFRELNLPVRRDEVYYDLRKPPYPPEEIPVLYRFEPEN